MKQVCSLLMLVVALGFSGCSSQDFGRPIARIGDVVDSGKDYVKSNSEQESLRRATQLAEILAEWERQKGAVDEDYTLGPDDVLTIGILSLETPDEVASLVRTISKDGTISLPLVGAIQCAGLTARQLQKNVITAYQGNYLQDPQVDVAVTEYLSAPVVVTGAVGQPGVYYLRHNHSTVLEVLSMANGLTKEAGKNLLIVRKRAPTTPDASVTPDQEPRPPTPLSSPVAAEPLRLEQQQNEAAPEPWTGSHIADLVEAMASDQEVDAEQGPWTGSHIADRVAALAAEEDSTETETNVVAEVTEAPLEDAIPQPQAEDTAVHQAVEANPEVANDEAALDADLITVDLEGLLDEGDIRLNMSICGGDIVTVPPGRQEYVYVLGYVQRPGAFELKGRARVRALQAVAMAGGLSGAARAQNSFLIIDKPGGRQVVSIDLTKIARGQRPPVYMESGYTLVVGSGVFARLAEFIRPTVSAGANLTPGP